MQHIRSSLTAAMAKTVASALVNSRFDSANAVLYGASEHNLAKLRRAQNALAQVVTFTKHADHNPTSAAEATLVTNQIQN